MVSFILKPLCIFFLLLGMFGLICLRSNIVKLEYELSSLEKKEAECIKERRMLLAEKAGLQSFEKVHASMRGNYNLVFPDRVKVVHVKAQKGSLPHEVSLREKVVGP